MRFDYAPRTTAAHLTSLRRPFAACAAGLSVGLMVHAAEASREAALASAVSAESRRLAVVERATAALHALERERASLIARVAATDAVRGSGPARARDLAAIGNAIPPAAWLSALRVDAGTYTLDARARSLVAVVATVAALRALPGVGPIRVGSARDEGHDDIADSLAMGRPR